VAILVGLGVFLGSTPVKAGQGVGYCRFDLARLQFEGNPRRQARCLLGANPPPAALAARLGQTPGISREGLERYLTDHRLANGLAFGLRAPISRARDNTSEAPAARYFVIHDTSQPYLGSGPFPADIDTSAPINDLSGYAGPDAVAHVFINRRGELLIGHDFGTPWRATKLESRVIGVASKGLFVHIETQQPRREDPLGPPGNDRIAPVPGFSPDQYATLAAVYVVASFRAGAWLIPAFHSMIDRGLEDGHDDPRNFDLPAFDRAIRQVLIAVKASADKHGMSNRG
jgi:hypothetical protein